ncbi:sensor histidine kinase [Kineococcus sp. R8]|nr:sensor histidine kinase [Kineococcus siccus]
MRGLPPLLPVLAGVLLWGLWRAGELPGGASRVGAEVTARPGDWVLAAGALATVVLLLGALRRRRARVARERALRAVAAQGAGDRQRLVGRLDHELKNPLTAIRLALANLAADDPRPQQAAGLRSIEEQVLRLSRLTTDLRKIADVETSRLDTTDVDVTALLEEALEVVGEQPRAAGRTLRLDAPRAPWPLPRVQGDADLLVLAFVNLVDNAVKYTADGATVEVRARESGPDVLVEVADTGHGISADDLPHVWEELFRSQQARAVPGSGLGLPFVRAVVHRHGGSVTADSREGEGTVVRVVLPVRQPAEA